MPESAYVQEIEEAINLVRARVKMLEDPDEEKTKKELIYPVIKALGWNELRIIPEYGQNLVDGRMGRRVDYALFHTLTFGDLNPPVIVEAKRLSQSLGGKDENQLKEYAEICRPDYAVLTNGRTWCIYGLVKNNVSNFSMVDIIDIMYDSPSDIAKRLSRVSNDGQ